MSNNLSPDIQESPAAYLSEQASIELKSFIEQLYDSGSQEYATFSFPIDAIDPLAYLEMCWQKDCFEYYWEKPADEFAIAAGSELINISATGTNRFAKSHAQVTALKDQTAEFSAVSHPYSGLMFLGGFSFFNEVTDTPWKSFDPASLTIPKWLIVKDGKFTIATIAVSLGSFSSPGALYHYIREKLNQLSNVTPTDTDENEPIRDSEIRPPLPGVGKADYNHWISSVKTAKHHIEHGQFKKIVLARHIAVSNFETITPTQVINNLRQQYTNCYNFLVHSAHGDTFLGSTPERLGSFRKRLFLTDALAGSIKRGRTATEDSMLEKDLSASPKNRNEHNFVVKAIEERLAPFAASVNRSRQPEVKKLSNVQHLYTPIRAQLRPDAGILEVIGQLHPTPAVGGYPWQKAKPFISELEDFDRGWYAGPVGWLNSKGTGEFAVAIRSGLLTKEEAHFFAGCGIVADSDPSAEWEETNLKLKPMLSALQYD
ncbi:MAG TPA: isochorismate synthase [Balneolaceae bacterium]|nr:isochorismate synthase [Balneolaceae bacterium]